MTFKYSRKKLSRKKLSRKKLSRKKHSRKKQSRKKQSRKRNSRKKYLRNRQYGGAMVTRNENELISLITPLDRKSISSSIDDIRRNFSSLLQPLYKHINDSIVANKIGIDKDLVNYIIHLHINRLVDKLYKKKAEYTPNSLIKEINAITTFYNKNGMKKIHNGGAGETNYINTLFSNLLWMVFTAFSTSMLNIYVRNMEECKDDPPEFLLASDDGLVGEEAVWSRFRKGGILTWPLGNSKRSTQQVFTEPAPTEYISGPRFSETTVDKHCTKTQDYLNTLYRKMHSPEPLEMPWHQTADNKPFSNELKPHAKNIYIDGLRETCKRSTGVCEEEIHKYLNIHIRYLIGSVLILLMVFIACKGTPKVWNKIFNKPIVPRPPLDEPVFVDHLAPPPPPILLGDGDLDELIAANQPRPPADPIEPDLSDLDRRLAALNDLPRAAAPTPPGATARPSSDPIEHDDLYRRLAALEEKEDPGE